MSEARDCIEDPYYLWLDEQAVNRMAMHALMDVGKLYNRVTVLTTAHRDLRYLLHERFWSEVLICAFLLWLKDEQIADGVDAETFCAMLATSRIDERVRC